MTKISWPTKSKIFTFRLFTEKNADASFKPTPMYYNRSTMLLVRRMRLKKRGCERRRNTVGFQLC